MSLQEGDNPTILRKRWVKHNIDVNGRQASALHDAFVTKDQLVDALESGEDLEAYDGIGEKTASAVWKWFHEVYNGTIEPDGTLLLDDDGLHLPDWLVGYTGTFNVETPTITIRPTTTDEGLQETSDILGTYPNDGDWNERLEAGMIALSTTRHPERIYEIDDRRSVENGGER